MKREEVLKQKLAESVIHFASDRVICCSWFLHQPQRPKALKHTASKKK